MAVPPALALTLLICASPSGDARMSLGVATPLSAKFFETMLSTPAWILFWRCNPHAPGGATHASQRCFASKRFSPIPGIASRRCSDGVSHTRRDVASPTSVIVHSIATIVEPGLGGGPTLALLRTVSPAEFTYLSPSWRLIQDRSCTLSFLTQHRCCFLHCLPITVSQRHPRSCCCGATRQHR